MLCRKCGKDLPDESKFCNYCGAKQEYEKTKSRRGNGNGSVFKLPNGSYKAVATLVWYVNEDGKERKITRSKICKTKKEALAAIPILKNKDNKPKAKMTFKGLYDKWFPTHRAGKSTMDCYKAAMKHFSSVWFYPLEDLEIDDLQECLDTCGKGKRTQENMKALCGLMYKYGEPRHSIPVSRNLGHYLVVGGEKGPHRESFTSEQIELIQKQIGITKYADYVYCLIYLGFRPTEFLTLDISNYDSRRRCFIGGAKTEAGINRIVTISPKIRPYIDDIIDGRTSGPVFCNENGQMWNLKDFTEKAFYLVLAAAGIENPMVKIGGDIMRHKYTPHTCRHTFATLLKNISASDKDKLALIGHASEEMLRYYQDVNLEDLERITDLI